MCLFTNTAQKSYDMSHTSATYKYVSDHPAVACRGVWMSLANFCETSWLDASTAHRQLSFKTNVQIRCPPPDRIFVDAQSSSIQRRVRTGRWPFASIGSLYKVGHPIKYCLWGSTMDGMVRASNHRVSTVAYAPLVPCVRRTLQRVWFMVLIPVFYRLPDTRWLSLCRLSSRSQDLYVVSNLN